MTANLKLKIETAFVMLFSLAVVASITPTFSGISNFAIVIYYMFVPGYTIAGLLGENYGFIQRFLFSIFFGIALVLGIFSIRQIGNTSLHLPYAGIIPVITIIVAGYQYYHVRSVSA